jgi:hypothetical protein
VHVVAGGIAGHCAHAWYGRQTRRWDGNHGRR